MVSVTILLSKIWIIGLIKLETTNFPYLFYIISFGVNGSLSPEILIVMVPYNYIAVSFNWIWSSLIYIGLYSTVEK